jgi:phosphoglycerate dehydrogenase-like enzyme
MKLLIYPAIEDARLVQISATVPDSTIVNAVDESQALSAIGDADAFFGKITPSLLAQARQLRWIQAPTASLEHYVFPELIAHPCVLTNMRGLFSDVIAEQVFGYLICFARNLPRYIRNQTQAHWEPVGGDAARVSFTTGPGVVNAIDRAHRPLAEATLGIVGLGSIGAEIARIGSAFRMKTLAVDPLRTQPSEGVAELWPVERLPDLLTASDYVVIAAPHTPDTAKMFRRPQFQQMKRSAYLINIGRGAIVDLTDLTASLQAGEIAGAALDVFETEPLPSDHPLWRFENVIITPHVAGYSPRIAERHLQVLLDNLQRFTRGEALQNLVDKKQWF